MNEKTLKFIEKAKMLHDSKYDYSLVNYIESKYNINIICPVHGEFSQRASGHLSGYGCQKCSSDNQRLSYDKFIEKAKMVHGSKYDYSLVNYINFDTKIKIICSEHGIFEQTPNNHLKGYHCEKCSFISRRTGNDKFVEKSKMVHGSKYDYSLVNYKTSHIKVNITCLKHGTFSQTPHNHLKGDGCPMCNESKGEKKIREFLNSNSITFTPQKRFKDCKDKICLPFDFYLPEYNTCIEYNGIQHYKPIEYFGGQNGLLEQKKKDKIKKDYCLLNNICLIIVKYNQKDNKILKKIKDYEKNNI